jgi:hypothetical protein
MRHILLLYYPLLKQVGSKGKRPVYAHDTVDHDGDDFYAASWDDDPFDLDTPVDKIQTFVPKFTPRKGPGGFNSKEMYAKEQIVCFRSKD